MTALLEFTYKLSYLNFTNTVMNLHFLSPLIHVRDQYFRFHRNEQSKDVSPYYIISTRNIKKSIVGISSD